MAQVRPFQPSRFFGSLIPVRSAGIFFLARSVVAVRDEGTVLFPQNLQPWESLTKVNLIFSICKRHSELFLSWTQFLLVSQPGNPSLK